MQNNVQHHSNDLNDSPDFIVKNIFASYGMLSLLHLPAVIGIK